MSGIIYFPDIFVNNFFPQRETFFQKTATEIFKLTHQEFSDKYRKRDFLMDYPAGYLVCKLDEYLRTNNMPLTQIEYGSWPTIKWLKEMIR